MTLVRCLPIVEATVEASVSNVWKLLDARAMKSAIAVVLSAVIVLTSTLSGCDKGGHKIVKVSGVLTRNGKPVPNLEVYFMPTHGRNSVGMADAQGRFALGYTPDQDGALVGTHTVFVVFNPPRSGAERIAAPDDVKPILEKYGTKETSPLTVEITKAVSNLEIKLD